MLRFRLLPLTQKPTRASSDSLGDRFNADAEDRPWLDLGPRGFCRVGTELEGKSDLHQAQAYSPPPPLCV